MLCVTSNNACSSVVLQLNLIQNDPCPSLAPPENLLQVLGLSDLINAMLLMDAPSLETVLLGIQPESTDWGPVLTPKVEAAQRSLLEAALEQISQWEAQISGIAVDSIPM